MVANNRSQSQKKANVPTISLANFDQRKHEIANQLGEAARNVGFFYIADHGCEGLA